MASRKLRSFILRLVLVTGLAAMVATGSLGFAGPQGAAAMPMQCRTLWSQARYFASQAEYYRSIGDTFNYLINRANAEASFNAFNDACW